MTSKVITLEFVVPTALAIALGIALSIGAVYLMDRYLFPVDQLEADYAAVDKPLMPDNSPTEQRPEWRPGVSSSIR
jgi:hypothetical protein